jgi:Spy/CpxP family protein refolding chaperone
MMEQMQDMMGAGDIREAEDEDEATPEEMRGAGGRMGRGRRMGRGGMMGMMGRGGMRGHGAMLERLAQQLALTDEQRTQVQALWRAHRKSAVRTEAEIEVMALDLHELLEAEPVPLPKVKDLVQAMATKKADLHFAHITLMQEVRKLLNAEQQQKLRMMMHQMLAGHGLPGSMGTGGMRRHGPGAR